MPFRWIDSYVISHSVSGNFFCSAVCFIIIQPIQLSFDYCLCGTSFSSFHFQPTYTVRFEVNFFSVDQFIDSVNLSFHLNCCLRPFTSNVILLCQGLNLLGFFFFFFLSHSFGFFCLFVYVSLFSTSCGLLEYLLIRFTYSALCIFLCIVFLLFTLGIQLDIYSLSHLIGVSI